MNVENFPWNFYLDSYLIWEKITYEEKRFQMYVFDFKIFLIDINSRKLRNNMIGS